MNGGLKCPDCGGEARVFEHWFNKGNFRASCPAGCYQQYTEWYRSPSLAKKAWAEKVKCTPYPSQSISAPFPVYPWEK